MPRAWRAPGAVATYLMLLVGLLSSAWPRSAAGETIPLQRDRGAFHVVGRVNGAVSVNFVLDTGASDVLIPQEVADALTRSGALGRDDFIGTQTYQLADGSRVKSRRIVLRELTVGGQSVRNVVASIGPARSPALLGQTFLSKFPSWTLDNERQVLELGSRSEVAGSGDRGAGSARGGAKYGAFAHDNQTGRFGLSWNQSAPTGADEAALKGCASESCKVVFRTGPHQCGAIAMTEDGKVWGGATRAKRDEAELAALQNCQKRISGQCKLRGAECNR
jgi:clan AA aspartic protease (TIGR02281 family)